jgi:hydroxymethylpyrimidine/phosphomethylpyrimidine kinase
VISAYRGSLLPIATVATPNAVEAGRLVPGEAAEDAAATLLDEGCRAVLLTGGHSDDGPMVIDRLYSPGRPAVTFAAPRIAGRFHGTGCTLSSAIAAGLAMGRPLEDAIRIAEAFTHDAVRAAFRAGRGQLLLRRIRP